MAPAALALVGAATFALAACAAAADGPPVDAAAHPDGAASVDLAPPAVDQLPPAIDGRGDAGPVAFTCAGKSGTPGDKLVTLTSGGLLRSSVLHVPASYDPAHGAMLVLDFHGFSSDAVQQESVARFNGWSDKRGFLVASPQGVGRSWNAGQCCGDAWTNSVDDLAYVEALVAKISADYCVDPKRVHATGLSNGGFLSYRLACQLSNVVASISPVAGTVGVPDADCWPKRPVAVLHFHGSADQLVPYKGGYPLVGVPWSGVLDFRSVAAAVMLWRDRNGCLGSAQTVYQKGDATCQRWSACSAGADVELCTIDGGGHAWPGGTPIPFVGKTSTDIDATATMLDFFAAHPMP